MADSVRCPKCQAEIPLTDVIDHEIKEQLSARLAQELAGRDRQHKKAIAAKEDELRREYEEAQAEREKQVRSRAEQKVAHELADAASRIEEQEAELQSLRERELSLLQDRRKLDQERASLKLEAARKLDAERRKIAAQARAEAGEEHRLALRESALEVEQLKKQIKDLQEASQLSPSGLRGEAQEREIEHLLRERFRVDRIEPVKSGQRGADVLQTIQSPRGQVCGKILWESKRARNWNLAWVAKLKQDQMVAKADFAVLVCDALPPNVRYMELYEGVWVVEFICVVAIATALRECLISVAQAHSIDLNRSTALDAIYDYLSSSEFKRRISATVEAVHEMRNELQSERRVTEARWSRRAKQLDQLEFSTAGMYGELQALMGGALPAVEMLELEAPVELRPAS